MLLRQITPTMIAVLICAALAGCVSPVSGAVPSTPITASTPAAPIFATDEEALDAATKAYREYLAMSDKVAQEGGVGVERLAPFVTDSYLKKQSSTYAKLKSNGNHVSGETSFRRGRIQDSKLIDGVAHIRMYVCVDVSGVRVIDSNQIDVTPTTRPDQYSIVLGLIGRAGAEGLLLDSSELWEGRDLCVS